MNQGSTTGNSTPTAQIVELNAGYSYSADGQSGNSGTDTETIQCTWQAVSCPLENHPIFYNQLGNTFEITVKVLHNMSSVLERDYIAFETENKMITLVREACGVLATEAISTDTQKTSIITLGQFIQILKQESIKSVQKIISWMVAGTSKNIIIAYFKIYY